MADSTCWVVQKRLQFSAGVRGQHVLETLVLVFSLRHLAQTVFTNMQVGMTTVLPQYTCGLATRFGRNLYFNDPIGAAFRCGAHVISGMCT